DAAEALERASHDLLSNAGSDDIARHPEGSLADRHRERVGALAVAHVHSHRGAALMEALRGGAPNTAPGAGNDDDASDEVPCHSSLVIAYGTPEASWMMIMFPALSDRNGAHATKS